MPIFRARDKPEVERQGERARPALVGPGALGNRAALAAYFFFTYSLVKMPS